MAESPRPEPESAEPPEHTPDENDQNNTEKMSRPEDELGLGYDFEVKEQDRWLPIANGMFLFPLYHFLFCPFVLLAARAIGVSIDTFAAASAAFRLPGFRIAARATRAAPLV